jgi:hypothetical protein
VMSWPLRSLNLTVFCPTGSSLLVAVAGAVGSPGKRLPRSWHATPTLPHRTAPVKHVFD